MLLWVGLGFISQSDKNHNSPRKKTITINKTKNEAGFVKLYQCDFASSTLMQIMKR